MFWIRYGCSGMYKCVLGASVSVLDKERVFWCESECCGVNASFLDTLWVFWIAIAFLGISEGVLDKVQLFWSRCGCSG